MVSVSLLPRKGNCTKYFPHTGHLGLSPVLVAGTIKLDSRDEGEDIAVAQILVRLRCYEAVGGQAQLNKHFNENHLPENLNILWETASYIWPPPDNPQKLNTLIGDYQSQWRLIVPRTATDPNRLGFAIGSMTYKNWRSWWQLEAVVRGAPGEKTITKCYPLHLTNFHNLSPVGTLTHIHGSTTAPRIRYSLSCPTQVSCGDHLTVSLSINTDYLRETHLDPPKFKKVIIALERTLMTDTESVDTSNVGHPPPQNSKPLFFAASLSDAPSSTVPKLRSTRSLGKLRRKPSILPALRPHRKPVVSIVEAAEIPITSSDREKRTASRSSFAWSGSVDLTIPRPKSVYHYSIGDTCKTKFMTVTYHVTAKVVIKTKSKDTETVSLGACEVELSSVPTLDREAACRTYKRVPPDLGKFQGLSASIACDDQQVLGQPQPKVVTPTTMTL
ncbi:uncharacterized protein PGTG_16099 [Puccinia graminis f. sp. tritici CRL 75-36-700-3]|uniref:Arrestin C-terminal-like domain-containing protein n=1 Tax=Puccinia graminis f. sp. tritici (strain CRL 75-36-700-3 / race SCCL) TaxID=418459 RepID=E3L1T7_PUCGT|nr:uncharacterized protein PGTG_16099 [Puccinia graminis f. sp. tritici CRL 75-36-700-3]EFP90512.1 hypothetical protein PGTG_16099 [Puccinia graminis f. sp. tritici CRL 75-36-700-3]